jgi:hypothetical protein
MSSPTPTPNELRSRDPLAVAALLVALLALVFSLSGQAPAKRQAFGHRKHGAGRALANLKVQCPIANAIKLGSWCLEAAPYRVPPADAGRNDYFYATQACAREGGWLPSAAQLIGAARKAALQSTIDDSPATSGAEEFPDPTRGIKDRREMSGDLFTTTAGANAAGSEGVTVGSRGNTAQGEPDPTPMPANPSPETLDYVTVYDNRNHGGFAGGEPVGKAESFRCAYATGSQGKPKLSAGN